MEISKQEAQILWVILNNAQGQYLETLKDRYNDFPNAELALDKEHYEGMRTHWLCESKKEYDLLTDLKKKCEKVLFN